MKTFDYESAWLELARPGYEVLPADVRGLLARVAEDCADLRQGPDLGMPWPEDSDLRERFSKIPAEILAQAARTIHSLGHWYPGAVAQGYAVPGREHGAHWKFSHYADQSLRERTNVRNDDRFSGFAVRIIEGEIRVCYSSEDSWTWEIIGLASLEGVAWARETVIPAMLAYLAGLPRNKRDRAELDTAAYRAFEDLRAGKLIAGDRRLLALRSGWDLSKYMIEESEFEARRLARQPPGGST